MATKKKPLKERVKAKAKAVKAKVKAKIKASVAIMAAILSLVLYEGCSTATPASRATTATYQFRFELGDNAKSVTINTTMGDGALASADSEGSTETQTATPTLDIKPDIDLRYNDAIAGASAASKGVISSIGDGLDGVLALMQSKKSGTVNVTKKDGTSATVECKDGQCSFVDSASYDPDFPQVDDGVN